MLSFVLFGSLLIILGDTYRRTLVRNVAAEQRAHRAREMFETFMENSPVLSYSRKNDSIVFSENKAHEFIENALETDGEHTWVTVKFPVLEIEGKGLLAGAAIDITERKRAEDAIVKSRDELELVVE